MFLKQNFLGLSLYPLWISGLLSSRESQRVSCQQIGSWIRITLTVSWVPRGTKWTVRPIPVTAMAGMNGHPDRAVRSEAGLGTAGGFLQVWPVSTEESQDQCEDVCGAGWEGVPGCGV